VAVDVATQQIITSLYVYQNTKQGGVFFVSDGQGSIYIGMCMRQENKNKERRQEKYDTMINSKFHSALNSESETPPPFFFPPLGLHCFSGFPFSNISSNEKTV
jgi:hypothetical protein